MTSSRKTLCVVAALALGVTLSTATAISEPRAALGRGTRPARLSGSVDPVIRNRHGAILPFYSAPFPQPYIREVWFGAVSTPSITTVPPRRHPSTVTTPSITTAPPRGHTGTVTVTTTKTVLLRAGTITSYQTQTDVTTLYATKTIMQGFAQPQGFAKIIKFDRAAAANPDCGLEFVTKTATKSEFVNECSPSTTTITTNPFNTVTETITADPVTEIFKTVIVNSKSTEILALPSGTVTNTVTVVKPVTLTQSFACDLVTEYQTVTESSPVGGSEVCPNLATTVTKNFDSGVPSTVTKFATQTETETQTVNNMAACSDAATETARATRLTVLNYVYLTKTLKEYATYAKSCANSLVTATETINPTKTVNVMQVSYVTEFTTQSDMKSVCPDTVTVTPSAVTTKVVDLSITLMSTKVVGSYVFVDAGTEIFTVVPTVTVTDTETVDVTVTEIMADHLCAVIPI